MTQGAPLYLTQVLHERFYRHFVIIIYAEIIHYIKYLPESLLNFLIYLTLAIATN